VPPLLGRRVELARLAMHLPGNQARAPPRRSCLLGWNIERMRIANRSEAGPGYPSGCPGLFVCVVKNVPFGRCPDPRVYRTLAPKSGKCHFPPSDTCPRLFSGYAGLPIALGRGLLLANRSWRCFLTNALSWSDASGRSSRACARFWVANVTDPRRAWSATSLSYVDTFLVYKPR